MNHIIKVIIGVAAVVLCGCAANKPIEHIPQQVNNEPRKIAIFLDGTANNEGSHTNIAKLHNLTTLQNNPNIYATYIEGVGTNGKFIGMAMGWGIGHDVRKAYSFVADNYNPNRNDEIYIFGFSRGAYAARILASMIHVVGLPDIKHMSNNEKESYIDDIYDAYKGEKKLDQRRQDIMDVIGKMPQSVEVEFMGVWDTVEALGWPDYDENIINPNGRYGDQLCNIKDAAHAVSIDDDRARIFTPILLTRNHLVEECDAKVDISKRVDEVWFSGAHSDVGGGYSDTNISGVSLNWMLNKIKKYDLVPKGSSVYEDPFGKTHDPESGFFGLIYHKLTRDLPNYTNGSLYNNGKLKIHQSVLDRLSKIPANDFESKWYESNKYSKCFQLTKEGFKYISEKECFDVIGYM